MQSPRENSKQIEATPAHVLIAVVVIFIFFAPFILKFVFPDSGLTNWLITGIRVIWFYLLSYSGLVGLLYWVDHKRRRAGMSKGI